MRALFGLMVTFLGPAWLIADEKPAGKKPADVKITADTKDAIEDGLPSCDPRGWVRLERPFEKTYNLL